MPRALIFEQQEHQEERSDKKGIFSERRQEKFIEIKDMSFHIERAKKGPA